MGQRVSIPCVTGRCEKVRVQQPCGRYEEVKTPCMASKVMGKHPEYLVVHCSLVDGNTVDISVISPNEDLKPGVPYMLYPKVESTQLQGGGGGEVKSNIPGKVCMSVEHRQLTIRSSRSPDSMSKKSSSSKSFSKGDVDKSL